MTYNTRNCPLVPLLALSVTSTGVGAFAAQAVAGWCILNRLGLG